MKGTIMVLTGSLYNTGVGRNFRDKVVSRRREANLEKKGSDNYVTANSIKMDAAVEKFFSSVLVTERRELTERELEGIESLCS